MLNLGIYTIYWLSPLRTPRLWPRKNRQHRYAQPRETLALRQQDQSQRAGASLQERQLQARVPPHRYRSAYLERNEVGDDGMQVLARKAMRSLKAVNLSNLTSMQKTTESEPRECPSGYPAELYTWLSWC